MSSLDRLQAKFDPSTFLVLTFSIDWAGLPAVRRTCAGLGLNSLGIPCFKGRASEAGVVGTCTKDRK